MPIAAVMPGFTPTLPCLASSHVIKNREKYLYTKHTHGKYLNFARINHKSTKQKGQRIVAQIEPAYFLNTIRNQADSELEKATYGRR